MDSGLKVFVNYLMQSTTNAPVIMNVYNDPFCDWHLFVFVFVLQLMGFEIVFCYSTYRLTVLLLMATCGSSYTCTVFYLTSPLMMDVQVPARFFLYCK